MNMTESRQLVLTVLNNGTYGGNGPYASVWDIRYALKKGLKEGGIYKDLKKVPSWHQIHRTLQGLLEEELVLTSIRPIDQFTELTDHYYVLASLGVRHELICKCNALYGRIDTAKFGVNIFGVVGFYGLQPEEIPPLLLNAQLLMDRTHPDKSEGYEEQFEQMKKCVAWINDGIPLPTDKPHSPVVTEHAKHLSNLDPDFV